MSTTPKDDGGAAVIWRMCLHLWHRAKARPAKCPCCGEPARKL